MRTSLCKRSSFYHDVSPPVTTTWGSTDRRESLRAAAVTASDAVERPRPRSQEVSACALGLGPVSTSFVPRRDINRWSKGFLKVGKKRVAGDTLRVATASLLRYPDR
jgi:hypothetical protein